MRKFLALLFALLLCTATKVYAEDAATVTVAVKDLPPKLQNRTVIVILAIAHLIQNQQLLFWMG